MNADESIFMDRGDVHGMAICPELAEGMRPWAEGRSAPFDCAGAPTPAPLRVLRLAG